MGYRFDDKKHKRELPRELQIGYRTYRVDEVPGTPMGDAVGTHQWLAGVITVDSLQDQIEKANTVIHEVMHAYVRMHSLPVGDADSEEIIVRVLANAMCDLCRRNPEFMKFLVKAVKS